MRKASYSFLWILLVAAPSLAQQSPLAPPKMSETPAGASVKLKVGDKAPDFALPNGDGNLVKLSDYTSKQPVVVIFYRGFW